MSETAISLGIVLKAAPHRESDIRLQIFTADGMVTATATGAQKPTAKLKAAAQPFTIAEFEITADRLTGAHVLTHAMPLTREINRYYLACSIAEVLLQIRALDAQIFILTARTFEELIETKTSAYKIFIDFFGKLLALLGFDIQLKIPENLGLSDAKKLVMQISAAFEQHLDILIPCVSKFLS